MRRPAAAALGAVLLGGLAGCGDASDQRPPPPSAGPTCADLRDTARLRQVARSLVVRVVAPDGQSQAETADLIAGSLRATCSQPGRAGSRPVAEVLRAVQRHLDEDAIYEAR